MADYQGSYATPRADLGMALMEYWREGGGNWVTERALPRLTVPKKAATFTAWTRASILRVDNVKRSFRGQFNRVTGDGKDHSYNCQDYGVESLVDDGERAFFSKDFDSDLQATMLCEQRIRRAQEVRTANLLFSQNTFTGANFTDNSATDPWTGLSADIYGQVLTAKEASRRQTGIMPNKMLVSRPTFNLMKNNTDLKNRRNVTVLLSDQEIEDSLQELLGLEDLIIADEVYNSASEGSTASVTDIWSGSYALLFYACREGATLAEPSMGRTIEWEFLPEFLVTSYRAEDRKSDVYRCEHFVQEYLYDQAYGNLIKIK